MDKSAGESMNKTESRERLISMQGLAIDNDLESVQSAHSPSINRKNKIKKKNGLKHQEKKDSLDLYHSLDISGNETPGIVVSDHSINDSIFFPDLSESSVTDKSYLPNTAAQSLALGYISDYSTDSILRKKCKEKKSKKLRATSYILEDTLSCTNSLGNTPPSTAPSSVATYSPSASRYNTLGFNKSSIIRSPSVCSNLSFNSAPRRKRFSLFGHKHSHLMSASMSSISSSQLQNDTKIPSPARFASMYHALRQGISEHISVNTAELNVLQVRKKEVGTFNVAHSYDFGKTIKLLERVIQKLQYQQTRIDEIYETYTMQQRYRDGAFKLKSAFNSSRVSSRSSMHEIKTDLSRCTETLCTLEHELTSLFGRFDLEMRGLLGFARLRSGDQYEVVIRYGSQKWRMRGNVKPSALQSWDNINRSFLPLFSDLINIKVMEIKSLGKHMTVGSVSCETKELFKVESQDLVVDLNDTASLKLSLNVKWSPYNGYEAPSNLSNHDRSLPVNVARSRTRSMSDRSVSAYVTPRRKQSSSFSRPFSVIYPSSANTNNSNNKSLVEISLPIMPGNGGVRSGAGDEDVKKQCDSPEIKNTAPHECSESAGGVEEVFVTAISKKAQLVSHLTDVDDVHLPSLETELLSMQKNSPDKIAISHRLATVAMNLNFLMDDYRGRYRELYHLEDILLKLVRKIKNTGGDLIATDGFEVIAEENYDYENRFATGPTPSSGRLACDEALIPHLVLVQSLLKDVGTFGPLKVKETIALDKLLKQGDIISRIFEIASAEEEVTFDEMPEFSKRKTLLEIWRSCCDGNPLFCVTAKTLQLELASAFGRNVRNKHADVAEQVFPELVRRIIGQPDLKEIENESVTLFHVSAYVDQAADDGECEDFEKLIDKLALEMFITSTLSSGIDSLVLVAIKRVSSLLALRVSNLRALSHLLLDEDHKIRTAAAAHIRHISTEELLREKAIVSYAELLESPSKLDRQCSCIAIGFLSATQCIPSLAYIYHCDTEIDVRNAASNVLLSFGEEGEAARNHVTSTLLTQTMSQQVSLNDGTRMGTAL